jgi:hypothetical protein
MIGKNGPLQANSFTKQGVPLRRLWALICLLSLVPILFALHRFFLYLEKRGIIYYWHNKPSGGGYNPLYEIYQPQIRHVMEVREQRLGEERGDKGEPAVPKA